MDVPFRNVPAGSSMHIQNGRSRNGRSLKRQKHKTAGGTKRHKLKTAKTQNGRRHKTADGTNQQTIYTILHIFYGVMFKQKDNTYK
jgi:hypothetical protein